MATSLPLSTRQGADQLSPFLLSNVKPTGKRLGGGAYGVVEELEMDGRVCAGKKIYDILIDPKNEGAERMVDRYYTECRLLSELRHPNIVHFLGICFLPDTQLPVLVMERLQRSLDEFLETTPDVSLPTKLSILQDVARGLAFMHNRKPAVIHRDLTARNVLLDRAMTAKIADLGNSRIANIRPGQLAQTMTQGIPGTLVYMPPEALGSTQRYGPSLDMFSFGHLALFVAIQVFPKDLHAPTFADPITQEIKACTELQRREEYIITLDGKLGKWHSLVSFIKECLADVPANRPTAMKALERLEVMGRKLAGPIEYYDILLIGKTGQGKSATGNRLLGKECLLTDSKYTAIEDKTFPFFIAGRSLNFCTRYCKVIANPESKVRVMDSPGFGNLIREGQTLYENNLEIFRQIISTQKEHKMKFARILYFLPVCGPLQVADRMFQDEIKVMFGFFGRQIFNIMVIIATNYGDSRYQRLGFNDDDMKKTQESFLTAVRRVTKLEACPPILYLPVDETDVLDKVKKAQVLDDAPFSILVGDMCAKCAKRLIYTVVRNQRVLTRVIEDEGLPTEKEIHVDRSLCHPYFIKRWFSEKCANCGQSPGSRGCRINKTKFPKKDTPNGEIEVCHSAEIH